MRMTVKEKSLPNAKVKQIVSLLEKLDILGASDKEGLAYALNIRPQSIDNPLKAAEMLGFVSIVKHRVELTKAGQEFVDSNLIERKEIFRQQMLRTEPWSTISKVLEKQKELSREDILRFVKAKITAARKWKPSTDKEMLKMLINWGTYSGLFKADSKSKRLLPAGELAHDD